MKLSAKQNEALALVYGTALAGILARLAAPDGSTSAAMLLDVEGIASKALKDALEIAEPQTVVVSAPLAEGVARLDATGEVL